MLEDFLNSFAGCIPGPILGFHMPNDAINLVEGNEKKKAGIELAKSTAMERERERECVCV
jgi:hypothetical protein